MKPASGQNIGRLVLTALLLPLRCRDVSSSAVVGQAGPSTASAVSGDAAFGFEKFINSNTLDSDDRTPHSRDVLSGLESVAVVDSRTGPTFAESQEDNFSSTVGLFSERNALLESTPPSVAAGRHNVSSSMPMVRRFATTTAATPPRDNFDDHLNSVKTSDLYMEIIFWERVVKCVLTTISASYKSILLTYFQNTKSSDRLAGRNRTHNCSFFVSTVMGSRWDVFYTQKPMDAEAAATCVTSNHSYDCLESSFGHFRSHSEVVGVTISSRNRTRPYELVMLFKRLVPPLEKRYLSERHG